MAVQGRDEDLRLCERCFARVATDAEFCQECGAPVSDEPHSDGSDNAIYPELARANLLRMRGEYAQAEDVCLKLLHRYPNNATANGLLGDICAERGDLEQAAEWYELALDIMPGEQGVLQKLNAVKERMRQREAASTAQQLGLPTSKSKAGVWIVVAILVLVGTGVFAYILGERMSAGRVAKSPVVNAPVTLEPKPPPAGTEAGTQPEGAQPAGTEAPPMRIDDDRQLTQLLAQRAQDGARLLEARQDVRSKNMTLTFIVQESEDPRPIAARLASTAMEQSPDCRLVTLRGVQGARVVYMADVHRDALTATTSAEWQDAHANDPMALANAILSNEWPSSQPMAPAEPADAGGGATPGGQ